MTSTPYELLRYAAAGGTLSRDELATLPASCRAAVPAIKQHHADGEHGLARRLADEVSEPYDRTPTVTPDPDRYDQLSPTQLAEQVRRGFAAL